MKIVIVGAGAAGLSIGWKLAEAGAETVVLERAQPGSGATWAAAGMLAATAESGQAPETERVFSSKAMALWPVFAESMEAASGRSIAFRREGSLIVARNATEASALRTRADAGGGTVLAATDVRAMEPLLAPDIEAALWAPDDAQVDNRALGRALTAAFLRAGGTLRANEAVVRIERLTGGRIGARTPFGFHEADAVILAAGAWTARIEGLPPGAVPPVRPVKGEMIAVAPTAGEALPRRLVWGDGVYLVPRRDRLLIGATVTDSGFDTGLTANARDWLRERAGALMPALFNWSLVEHWAGLRPGSPDGLPLLGATAMNGLYVASGQYRNGILFAPVIAETMCRLVLERYSPPEIVAFDPMRFQNGTVL